MKKEFSIIGWVLAIAMPIIFLWGVPTIDKAHKKHFQVVYYSVSDSEPFQIIAVNKNRKSKKKFDIVIINNTDYKDEQIYVDGRGLK